MNCSFFATYLDQKIYTFLIAHGHLPLIVIATTVGYHESENEMMRHDFFLVSPYFEIELLRYGNLPI